MVSDQNIMMRITVADRLDDDSTLGPAKQNIGNIKDIGKNSRNLTEIVMKITVWSKRSFLSVLSHSNPLVYNVLKWPGAL